MHFHHCTDLVFIFFKFFKSQNGIYFSSIPFTYIDNTNRYPKDSKREHEYDCHEELFGIFYKKSAKRSNKFWSDHDSSSISKRNVYFGFFFFMSLWYTYSLRVSKEEQLVPAAIRLIITVETCQMINSFQRFNLSLSSPL